MKLCLAADGFEVQASLLGFLGWSRCRYGDSRVTPITRVLIFRNGLA
jgi:hypothetical protein